MTNHALIPILLWRADVYKKDKDIDKAEDDVEKVYHLFAEFYLNKIDVSDIL